MSEPDSSADMSSAAFDANSYFEKLIQEASLEKLIETESCLKTDVRRLDSEMQTLVYENYNKFISATDTVSKMKIDFRAMEQDMQQLASLMRQISTDSSAVTSALQDKRDQIDKLSSTDETLKKLQFLFELPSKLREAIADQNYSQAVNHYMHAQSALEQYCHLPSLQELHRETQQCIDHLSASLNDNITNYQVTFEQLTESAVLLTRLGQTRASQLTEPVLANMRHHLSRELAPLSEQVDIACGTAQNSLLPVDVLQFMDLVCEGYMSVLHSCIVSYSEIFNNIDDSLVAFVGERLSELVALCASRLRAEQAADAALMARALDKLQRRLEQLDQLLPPCSRADRAAARGRHLMQTVVEHVSSCVLASLQQQLQQRLHQLRVTLATCGPAEDAPLGPLFSQLLAAVTEEVTSAVESLKVFCRPDPSLVSDTGLGGVSVQMVREGVVVEYLRRLASFSRSLSCSDQPRLPPSVLLLFCRLCRELQVSVVQSLLSEVDATLGVGDLANEEATLTPVSQLIDLMQTAAAHLLSTFVYCQSNTVSQMLRKSVDSRDWLGTVEPRCVRAVMRRVQEELSAIDSSVSLLFEEGHRRDRSSDSSRRMFIRRDWPSYSSTTSSVNSNLAANIQKLFSDQVDLFAPVDFTRVSILTAIVKIALKTFSECVRLQTFSRFGLQQMQVDVQFLHINVWRFVSDEKLLRRLLDDVMASTLNRCIEPVLMDFSVVESLADRS